MARIDLATTRQKAGWGAIASLISFLLFGAGYKVGTPDGEPTEEVKQQECLTKGDMEFPIKKILEACEKSPPPDESEEETTKDGGSSSSAPTEDGGAEGAQECPVCEECATCDCKSQVEEAVLEVSRALQECRARLSEGGGGGAITPPNGGNSVNPTVGFYSWEFWWANGKRDWTCTTCPHGSTPALVGDFYKAVYKVQGLYYDCGTPLQVIGFHGTSGPSDFTSANKAEVKCLLTDGPDAG